MVVRQLKSEELINSSIADEKFKAEVESVSKHLRVSKHSKLRKRLESNQVSPKTKIGGSKESPPKRRYSARIQTKLKEEKEQLVRKRVELLDKEEDGGGSEKNIACSKRRRKEKGVGHKNVKVEEQRVKSAIKLRVVMRNRPINRDSGVDGTNAAGKSDFARAKDTLRSFNKHYLHFVQEEEKRCRKTQADSKGSKKGSKSKKGRQPNIKSTTKRPDLKAISKKGRQPNTKSTTKRPDLKAISKMMENNEILYPEKRIGSIPGINVGHQFYSRAEMVAIGFHSHWLNGIDYMGKSYCKKHSSYKFPLAVAIVLSGMYEDDLDNAEDIIYTGQGGHNLTGDKRQISDQVMERGNLALKNSVEQSLPVRVIRGHGSASSYCGRVYTYDGLYKVVNYWAEKGISGFTVFKYRLRRIEGQPILTTNQVIFTNGRVPQSVSDIRGLVCDDITGGQENIPIPATNLVDDPPLAPTGFTYCKSIQVSQNVRLPVEAPGCNCEGNCLDPKKCACALRNGSEFPYVSRDGGRLIEAKSVVFECGPNCGCGPDCLNRTSQRGLRYRLEVFRTPKKGWAVRSWDFIPSGAPVCEYTGVLTRTEDLDNVSENNYIFDIDCLQTMRGLDGRERRLGDAAFPTLKLLDNHNDQKSETLPEFCIDAGPTGNIARFINHSCEPNLFVQCVLGSHHDIRLARVMLFAADNIPPLQELTYDYGYALNSVLGPDGKIKKMLCYCGAAGCRKRLF